MRIGKWAPILSQLTKYLLDLGSHSQPFPLKCWEVISDGELHFSQAVSLVKSWSCLWKPAAFWGREELGFSVQRHYWEMVGAESGSPESAKSASSPHSRRAVQHPPPSLASEFPRCLAAQFPNLRICQPWQCCLSASHASEKEWDNSCDHECMPFSISSLW